MGTSTVKSHDSAVTSLECLLATAGFHGSVPKDVGSAWSVECSNSCTRSTHHIILHRMLMSYKDSWYLVYASVSNTYRPGGTPNPCLREYRNESR